jgi:hypothetical protein
VIIITTVLTKKIGSTPYQKHRAVGHSKAGMTKEGEKPFAVGKVVTDKIRMDISIM